jgi:ATP-dependent DNA helicase RecQ
VRHAEFGEGQVMREEGDTVVVLFDESGYRTLAAEWVETAGLLIDASLGEPDSD